MPQFVLNRNHTMRSLMGRSVAFEKGVPTHVPHELVKEAVGLGAECIDEVVDVLGPEPSVKRDPSGDEREALINAAFDDLVLANNRNDFTGNGVPSKPAVVKAVGFEVDKREIESLWRARAEKAAAE